MSLEVDLDVEGAYAIEVHAVLRRARRRTEGGARNRDGFLKNEAIKILMPEKLRRLDKGLRAAERAAPSANSIFKDALKHMTFSDAKQILRGGDTAATEFFRARTRPPGSRSC